MNADLRLAGTATGCWLSALAGLHVTATTGWLVAAAAGIAAGALLLATRIASTRPASTIRVAGLPPKLAAPAAGARPAMGARVAGVRPKLAVPAVVARPAMGVTGRVSGTRGRSKVAALFAGARPAAAIGTILAAAALGVLCGAVATAARVGERDEQPLAGLARARATVQVGVVLTDDPRAVAGAVGRPPTYVVPTRLTWLRAGSGPRVEVGARILLLATDQAWRGLLPGQRVSASGRLSPARGGDLRAAVLSIAGAPASVSSAPAVQRAAGALRAGLQRACAPLPPEPGGLLPGLVVGDTSRLDAGLSEDFRATGLTHLVAVSGANAAIVCGLVLLIARWCRAGPRVTAVLCAAALVGFVILARPSPSVLRAAAMGGLALMALAAGRPRAAVPALSAAVVVLVIVDPELAGDPGFALSVLATGGLIMLAPGWAAALRARGIPAGVAEALAVPAAAQAACAPVIAALSATVSMTAIPANLLAAPAVAPATILGVFSAVLSPVWADGAAFAAWLASWPARWLVAIAHRGADVPDGLLPWPGGVFGGLLLAGLLMALLIAARNRVVRRLVLITTVAAVVGAVPVRLVTAGWPPPGWVVVACDVGQGDAVVLHAGPGSAVVVDAGPDPASVDQCLRRLGVASVPLLMISHFHVDHIGGLDGVFRGRTVDRVVVTPHAQPAAGRSGVFASAGRVPVEPAAAGSTYQVGAVQLTVLGPTHELTGTRSDPNNNSLVLLAVASGRRILLTGDAETEQQRALVSALQPGALRVDVLKVAHHGSAYQDEGFLAATGAGVGLVSVAADNDYGHPNPALLARLRRDGMRVLRTDEAGDLAVVVDDGRLAAITRGVAPGSRR
jgi:competence protein ComEC